MRLTSASGAPGITADARTTQLTIIDNDVLGVALMSLRSPPAFDETDGPDLFDLRGNPLEVVLTNAPRGVSEKLEIGLAARAATINDGGTAADVYFVEFGAMGPVEITSVTIFEGQTSTSVVLATISVDDDVVELTETVNLYIATVNGVPITDNGIDITINSNDSTEATLTVEDGA